MTNATDRAQCPNCGAPQSSLVKLGASFHEEFDYNSLMVDCLDCRTTPTREACERAFVESKLEAATAELESQVAGA